MKGPDNLLAANTNFVRAVELAKGLSDLSKQKQAADGPNYTSALLQAGKAFKRQSHRYEAYRYATNALAVWPEHPAARLWTKSCSSG